MKSRAKKKWVKKFVKNIILNGGMVNFSSYQECKPKTFYNKQYKFLQAMQKKGTDITLIMD